MDDIDAVTGAQLDQLYAARDVLSPRVAGAIRRALWANGYRPLSIPDARKFPTQKEWTTLARRNPPYWAENPPDTRHNGTGILADGLRAVDVDLAMDSDVWAVADMALDLLGWAPMRVRQNAARILILYRAAEGEPPKRKVKRDDDNAVEILGRGQQFVAYNRHETGVMYRWIDSISPLSVHRDDLTPVYEDQITEFLRECTVCLGIEDKVEQPVAPIISRSGAAGEVWPVEDIEAALAVIANTGDYDLWLRIGMASYAASGGTQAGLDAWRAWSREPASCAAKWRSFRIGKISAGTLAHYARRAADGWARPSRQLVLPPQGWSEYPV